MKTLTCFLTIFIFTTLLFAAEMEKEFKTTAGKELQVNLIHGGSITVEGWNENVVKVNARSGGRELDEDDVKMREHSGGVSISISPLNSDRGLELVIKVPQQYNLDLETMGGSISVTNVQGVIEGKTMGGSLFFDRLKGELQFTTMGGTVDMRDSEVDGNVKTMGGDIDFINVTGGIKSNTMGGDITMRNSQSGEKGKPSEVDISTMGGDILVDEAMQGVNAHTMGGEITIRKAGKYAKVKTMGGEIDIKEIDGRVEATTMGGDINVVMTGNPDKGERDVSLSSMGGSIDLTLPAG